MIFRMVRIFFERWVAEWISERWPLIGLDFGRGRTHNTSNNGLPWERTSACVMRERRSLFTVWDMRQKKGGGYGSQKDWPCIEPTEALIGGCRIVCSAAFLKSIQPTGVYPGQHV